MVFLPYEHADVRTRKWSKGDGEAGLDPDASAGKNMARNLKIASRNPVVAVAYSAASGLRKSHDLEHVPHSICESSVRHGRFLARADRLGIRPNHRPKAQSQ